MLLKKTKINQNTSSLGPKNTIFLSQQQLYQTELSWALPTRTELSRSCPNNNNNNNSNDNNNNGNNNNNNNSNNLIKSLSFYILHLNNLIPDLFETWNLKFNSTLLSWCVFNSDDIIEAPDQTDCIHDLKAESIRVFFDTFYQKVKQAVKSNPMRFSNPDFFFKE